MLTRHNTSSASEPNTGNPVRIHFQPFAAPADVAGRGALGHQSLDAQVGRKDLEPLFGLGQVRGHRRQLQRQRPPGSELFQPGAAGRPPLGPQVDTTDSEQVEGDIPRVSRPPEHAL